MKNSFSDSSRRQPLQLFLTSLLMVATSVSAGAQQSQNASPSGGSTPERIATQQPAKLTRGEAVNLALQQASAFQTARYSELIATEDVRQAKTAFLPKITVPSIVTYNSPTLGPVSPGTPRADQFSFISANAVAEYQSLIGAIGEIDITGRLRSALRRSIALLEAARAGTEVARRTLIQGVDDAYYGFALATAKRRASELSLTATEEFARTTELLFNAGEVAQVDVVRARLQLASRRDDLEQARAAESVAAGGLRVLVGYDLTAPLEIVELTNEKPNATDIDRFVASAVANRPELAQFDAEKRAAEQDVKAARAERLPQLTYSINGGFDTQSLKLDPLHDHTGVLATLSLTVPIFDWGASRSRERQAHLRIQSIEAERTLALRTLNQQFYAARSQALAAAARYEVLAQSVSEAERNVQTSIARYRAGEAPLLEVTDAFSTLATQRAALNQALFDYQSARSRLVQITAQ